MRGRDRRGLETARQREKGGPVRFCHGEGQGQPRRGKHAVRRVETPREGERQRMQPRGYGRNNQREKLSPERG